jgi:4,5-DOPA dioxygenase extradiol
MNTLSDNAFTRSLSSVAGSLGEKLAAVLVVSAHWLRRDSRVAATDGPETIHDVDGFPDEFYAADYPAPGVPEWVNRTA